MELGGLRRALRGGMLLAIVFVATGCASETPMPAPAPTPTYSSTYTAPEAMAIAPLTGMPVPVGALLTPSIAAKVDNHPDARPQVGLEHTDIVFEELVEGGMSRYVAVWQSNVPAEIGPVRSIRPMDPDIISPLGGIVAYSGGQSRFVAAMQAAPVVNVIHGSGTDDTFYRTDSKDSPHDVLVRAPLVIAQHLDLAPPPQQFAYSLDAASSTGAKDGAPIARIDLVIGGLATPSWGWDAASGKWLRFMTGGAPDTDSAGAQLGAANVIVLRVGVSYDGGIPKTELVGSGEAWIATSGGVVHATWSKGSMTDRIRLVDASGVTIRLAPGNTWVELVPLDGAVNFTAPPAA